MSKFAKACVLSYEEWVATIPEELPEPEYSKKHIRRMNALKNKMRGNVYHHFTTRTIKVMLVAAILLALMMTAFVIPSSRDSFMDNFNIASRYQMTKHNKNSVPDEITVGYIPEGFELESNENLSKYLILRYSNTQGIYFTTYKASSSTEIYFDTENLDTQNITINNINYTYGTDAFGNSNVIWTVNDYVFRIDGNLSAEELLKIAVTIK